MKTQFKFLLKSGNERVFRVDECIELEAPDYQQQGCGTETAGVVSVGHLLPGSQIDTDATTDAEKISLLESEVFWSNGIGDSPQSAFVIKQTRGSKGEDSYTEEDGFGLNATEVTGADEEWLYRSLNVKDNGPFVKAINARRTWHQVFVTSKREGDGYLAWYRENVNTKGSLLVPESTKERQTWSWRARASHDGRPPLAFIAPASIFIDE